MKCEKIFRDVASKIRSNLVWKTGNHDLDCYCAIASFKIWSALKKLGYSPTFVEYLGGKYGELCRYEGHCFVICNGYLIDVTATQFGWKEPVVVRTFREELYWYITHSARTVDGIKKLLKNWPVEQKPRRYA